MGCFGTDKDMLGFKNEIIYMVKGDSFSVKSTLKELGARYCRRFGWYFGSFADKPSTLPEGLELVSLTWEEVGNENGSLKNEDIIKAAVDSKMYDADPSEWLGNVGERIEAKITVENKREYDTDFDPKICYTFRDENRNVIVWFTSVSSKTSFEIGEECTIRGTVKTLDSFRNCKQTIVNRVNKRG